SWSASCPPPCQGDDMIGHPVDIVKRGGPAVAQMGRAHEPRWSRLLSFSTMSAGVVWDVSKVSSIGGRSRAKKASYEARRKSGSLDKAECARLGSAATRSNTRLRGTVSTTWCVRESQG